jgi:O-antigen ligase
LICVAVVRRQRSVGALLVLAGLGAAIVVLLLTSVEAVLVWSGRDPTLTGRTLIWQVTWELIQQRPILGFGYGAFWLEGNESASVLQEAVRWATPTAHNGYLDLILALGFVGLMLFALSAVTAILRLLAGIRDGDRALLLSCCASIAFVLLYNVAESAMLEQHQLLTYLYVWAAAAGGREVAAMQRAHHAAPYPV